MSDGNTQTPLLPSIKELGTDLLKLSLLQKVWTLAKPFLFFAGYFICASYKYWVPAFISIILLLFTTYVSTSHDLVHKNLGLNKKLNTFFLVLIEMLVLRSGHSFKLCHLNHHKHFPDKEDIEGASAHMSFVRTLAEGPLYPFRLFSWAWKNAGAEIRKWLLFELLCCLGFIAWSIYMLPVNLFFIYVVSVITGSWIYPLFTVYIPHDAKGKNKLFQTRLFRGAILSGVFAHHNYHLEHHLYPMVPHQNWFRLSQRLNPYFEKYSVKAITI
jgi:beta-carotene hydroxylase